MNICTANTPVYYFKLTPETTTNEIRCFVREVFERIGVCVTVQIHEDCKFIVKQVECSPSECIFVVDERMHPVKYGVFSESTFTTLYKPTENL